MRWLLGMGMLVSVGMVLSADRLAPSSGRSPLEHSTMTPQNRLAGEKSPYLLQHRDNPVAWYPWGEAAFAAAREQQKPVFLSIGYSTCHWCHVMAHDSFEDEAVARVLNQHFISIKLDREERPDLDQIYMDTVVALTGHGGWPLSVFLTPDRKPFFGGTFFWKAQFVELLGAIHTRWTHDRATIEGQSADLTQALQAHAAKSLAPGAIRPELLQGAYRDYQQRFDAAHGGFGGAPKFPPSVALQLLLRIHRRTGEAGALRMVTTTLDHMARGGMYDHLGGGFARYTTDAAWRVPHFEKMLYDNAQLAFTYLEAYQVTRTPREAAVARTTLDYVLRVMTHPEGGFYSAEDADSEGVEGKFYVWTYDELRQQLTTDELARMVKVYGVTPGGNFDHRTNILHVPGAAWPAPGDPVLASAQQKLLRVREQRVHPHKDDKILTAWNGLMIRAMAKGYQVLDDARYLRAAQRGAAFLRAQLVRDGRLLRRYREGAAAIDGFLEDYAYLISGLLLLYQSDFDPQWLAWAEQLQQTQDATFWDETTHGYFFAAPAADVIWRTQELHDGAMPSANAVAAENLLRLFALTTNLSYRQRAEFLLTRLAAAAHDAPTAYAQALLAMDWWLDRPVTVAVVGDPHDATARAMRRLCYDTYHPNLVLAIGPPESAPPLRNKTRLDGQTTIYVCEGELCHAPVTDARAARALLAGD